MDPLAGGLIRRPAGSVGLGMDGAPRPGQLIAIDVLGAGPQDATVEAVEPISYHGIPGLAQRIRLRLADGTRVQGLSLSGGAPWFADPRMRPRTRARASSPG